MVLFGKAVIANFPHFITFQWSTFMFSDLLLFALLIGVDAVNAKSALLFHIKSVPAVQTLLIPGRFLLCYICKNGRYSLLAA